MRDIEVRQLLDSFTRLLDADDGPKQCASTCTVGDVRFPKSFAAQFWTEDHEHPQAESSPCSAYLAAYAMMAPNRFPTDGLQLSDGKFFRPDKAVVRALLRSEDMRLNADVSLIEVPDSGRARIASDMSIATGRGLQL